METTTLNNFAKTIHDINKSDRDSLVVCAGFTGEGKSTFLIQLQKEYSKIAGRDWSFNNLTWSMDEVLNWIDGDKEGKGRKPEYTAILVDELISLFFKRNWYEDKQKGGVELLNKCRDRHLFIGGNIPHFWDLDSSFLTRVRFYIYIPTRGVAWIFQQENNPFSSDSWNLLDNRKRFRKSKTAYKLPNFVCELQFPDITPQEKVEYLKIRNSKRRNTENQNKEKDIERYGKIKGQRDILLRYIFDKDKKVTHKEMAELIDITAPQISRLRYGQR